MTGKSIADALAERFGAKVPLPPALESNETLRGMAARGSCRWFKSDPVPEDLLRALCAISLASPSKSDLQQRDIVLVQDPDKLSALKALVAGQAWIADAPGLLVFCANNRRQREMHGGWNRPFVNDHLDAFFNASVDAGIALSSFVHAAEAAGLGCCPISTIRNQPEEVSSLLSLPDHVFAVVGLAVGYPAFPSPRISMRLPLSATVHTDVFRDAPDAIQSYDLARQAHRPMTNPRQPETYGAVDPYLWSDDKTRQYAVPERAGFGAFIRRIGFRLD